jgi:D-xylulose 5-phosphate/D-fructose 6-phosphate phosphoketolase
VSKGAQRLVEHPPHDGQISGFPLTMTVQHAKRLEEGIKLPRRVPISSLNILLTSTCWRNDHNGFSHQGPGLIDTVLSKKGTVARIYLPPDANCLLSVADHCLRRGYSHPGNGGRDLVTTASPAGIEGAGRQCGGFDEALSARPAPTWHG